jgi:hypothetical protein
MSIHADCPPLRIHGWLANPPPRKLMSGARWFTMGIGRACALTALTAMPALADPALDVLVAAYPDHLVSHDGTTLLWKDGTRMPVSNGRAPRTFDELLDDPSVLDQFAIPYRLGSRFTAPARNEDPGRIRNEPFFLKMYGDCRNGEVAPRLVPVNWLPERGGGTLMATTVNGVADKLAALSRELAALPTEMNKYLVPSAGTYNCRAIAGTNRLSVHAYGAAIDLNSRFGDYWLWHKAKQGTFTWTNRIPAQIIETFERHDFIWGGKWYHFDTFHFEYRPEIIALAKQGWPRPEKRP